MAASRLFPEQKPDDDDTRKPHDKFSDFAAKVVRVPKSEIDKRQERWRKNGSTS